MAGQAHPHIHLLGSIGVVTAIGADREACHVSWPAAPSDKPDKYLIGREGQFQLAYAQSHSTSRLQSDESAGSIAAGEGVVDQLADPKGRMQTGLGILAVQRADGVVIGDLANGSAAAAVGPYLRVGDKILTVNGKHVSNTDDFMSLARGAKGSCKRLEVCRLRGRDQAAIGAKGSEGTCNGKGGERQLIFMMSLVVGCPGAHTLVGQIRDAQGASLAGAPRHAKNAAVDHAAVDGALDCGRAGRAEDSAILASPHTPECSPEADAENDGEQMDSSIQVIGSSNFRALPIPPASETSPPDRPRNGKLESVKDHIPVVMACPALAHTLSRALPATLTHAYRLTRAQTRGSLARVLIFLQVMAAWIPELSSPPQVRIQAAFSTAASPTKSRALTPPCTKTGADCSTLSPSVIPWSAAEAALSPEQLPADIAFDRLEVRAGNKSQRVRPFLQTLALLWALSSHTVQVMHPPIGTGSYKTVFKALLDGSSPVAALSVSRQSVRSALAEVAILQVVAAMRVHSGCELLFVLVYCKTKGNLVGCMCASVSRHIPTCPSSSAFLGTQAAAFGSSRSHLDIRVAPCPAYLHFPYHTSATLHLLLTSCVGGDRDVDASGHGRAQIARPHAFSR